ncbi:ADP-ribosylglycohydrolase family protein [Cryobacterium adonitolivorans]|uniref:ADP-ribosylglycohydrolase family protein n=2 Tax=Cryobacterium adonitolivorans TaxID=1259189 RepID=A0A4R8W2U3_9MICO|nr:ADP-ribosylglycohydrolase family protein [Cryobacterium adonitolivorans]
MPSQLMSRSEVLTRFGPGGVTGFEPAAAAHPIAAGLPAGTVTDDTDQALLLGRLLVAGRGRLAPAGLASALQEWEDRMRAAGSLDLLGPSTRGALARLRAGESVAEAGRFGATNGAAMRVAGVGILMPTGDLPALVDRVAETARLTHNTGVAIAGAAAVAAAVSAALEGATVAESTAVAIEAARLGALRGYWVAAGQVAARIRWAVDLMDARRPAESLEWVYELVGTSLASQESVPAAFAVLALYPGDPWQACLAAASLGGDSDTIAAMAGAVAGAVHGVDGFPPHAVETVRRVNDLDLEPIAAGLLVLRRSARAG